jgi:ribosomal protein L40E
MPIPVTCRCGQSFAAGDHLAGRTVQCPKCKSPLQIPAPQAVPAPTPLAAPMPGMGGPASIFDEAGMRTAAPGKPICPSCSAELPPNAVLCVKCGFHLQLGRRIGSQPGMTMPVPGDAHGTAAHATLAQAARTIDEDRENAKKEYQQGMPWWAIAGMLLFALTFLAAMLYLPAAQALYAGGMTIAVTCSLVQLYHMIRIWIIAFNENVVHGLACLFTWPCCMIYTIIYSFMHWDECGAHFLWIVIMWAVGNFLGGTMVAVSPLLEPNPNDFGHLSPPPRVYVMPADELPPRVVAWG